jgi:2-hydroxy-6-oxonona-2,4-dienedioate hydrolase
MTGNMSWILAAVLAAIGFAAWVWRSKKVAALKSNGKIRELKSHWIDVDGLRMHFRESTMAAKVSEVPVVLVHGFGVSSSYFVPTAERLPTEFDVYAPDLPGHGLSDTPPEALDIPGLAGALLGWMDAVGIAKAALVGNSMGCQIVVDLAVRHPQRVERLVLIGPAIDPQARTVLKHIPRFFLDALYERPSLIGIVTVDFLRMAWRAVKELRFMMEERIEAKLPLVTTPTMLVRGENDTIVPQAWFDEAARLVRAEEATVIAGWGHAVHYSAADELVEDISDFLRGGLSEACSAIQSDAET